jgi:serine/threonine protein kinase
MQELTGIVNERFEIVSKADTGGMGTVYHAVDRRDGAAVALKVLHDDAAQHIERFAREAKLLSELKHPGIVRFVDHGHAGDAPFLVMEWLDGESLAERLERELLTIGEALELGACVADALGAAHRSGIVHRDLKPGNVFLVESDVARPKLLDFGVASARGAHGELTDTRTVLGTPGYMAPEQIRASRDASPAADVFSLGCVLFKSLTGFIPFEGRNTLDLVVTMMTQPPTPISYVRSDATQALEELLSRMLDRDAQKRPADGAGAAALIRSVAAERKGEASERPPPPPSSKGPPTNITRVLGGGKR